MSYSIFGLKKEVRCEFPRKCFKTTENHSIAVCGSLWEETQFLLIFVPFYWLDQKKLFKQILIFLRICPFSNMLRITNFWVYLCSFLRYSLFRLKREVLCEFPRKCFKTTENHSITVCGSLCGEKKFLLIFVPFYWFDQKQLFKQVLIFLRIFLFSNMLRITNFLSISVLFSEIFTLWTKKRSSLWLFPKMLQKNKKS